MRDIVILESPAKKIVISSDCSASIGMSSDDVVRADPYIVGKYTARVAILEVVCVGAEPFAIVSGVSAETGVERIIDGIRSEAAGMKVFGSTETNFPSRVTFLNVFCLGFADELRIGRSESGDLVVAIGFPSVGYEVLKNEELLPNVETARRLLEFVHDIIPTGSRGVEHEIKVLEAETGLRFVKTDEDFPYSKSCGPSSVLVATLPESALDAIKRIGKPFRVLGRMK